MGSAYSSVGMWAHGAGAFGLRRVLDVDRPAGHLDPVGVREHLLHQTADLADGLTLGAQRDQEGRELHG